jgi:transposase
LNGEISERLKFIEERLRQYDLRIQRLFPQDERCRGLAALEGVGPLVATAVVAAVGNATEFKSGRELAAYLGLVPRHRATGGRPILLGISKRGDRYLRTLSIRGARSAMRTIERRRAARSIWQVASNSDVEATWRQWHWRTKTLESCGPCCLEERITAPRY